MPTDAKARFSRRLARELAGGDPDDDGTDDEIYPDDPIAMLAAVSDAVERDMMVFDALPPDPMAMPLEAARQRFWAEQAAWQRRGFRPNPNRQVLEELGLTMLQRPAAKPSNR
jgi:hypothetical protein